MGSQCVCWPVPLLRTAGGRVGLSRQLTPQPGQNFGEWITAADVVWTKEKPEFLSEYANVHHRDEATGNTWDSQSFYVQLAYRCPGSKANGSLISVRVYS